MQPFLQTISTIKTVASYNSGKASVLVLVSDINVIACRALVQSKVWLHSIFALMYIKQPRKLHLARLGQN